MLPERQSCFTASEHVRCFSPSDGLFWFALTDCPSCRLLCWVGPARLHMGSRELYSFSSLSPQRRGSGPWAFLGARDSAELPGAGSHCSVPAGWREPSQDHRTAADVSESVRSLSLELLWFPQRRALFIFVSLCSCQETSLQVAFIQVLHERR